MMNRLQEWGADHGWCQYPLPRRRAPRADFTTVLAHSSMAALLAIWGVFGTILGLAAITFGLFVIYLIVTFS